MKASTAVELAGFAFLTAAAFLLGQVPGLVVAGVCCLFIGYATDDEVTGLSVNRMVEPFRHRRAQMRANRAARKAARKADRRSRREPLAAK